jgi:hypothetical protein
MHMVQGNGSDGLSDRDQFRDVATCHGCHGCHAFAETAAHEHAGTGHRESMNSPGTRGVSIAGLAFLVIVAGYLLFAHGCHGDEDNELLSAVRWAVPGSR